MNDKILSKVCSQRGIERGEFVKDIAEMTDSEFEVFTKEIKKLIHHRDSTVNLYAMNSDPCDLLHKFWQRKSDACPLECTEAENQQDEFNDWVMDYYWKIEY